MLLHYQAPGQLPNKGSNKNIRIEEDKPIGLAYYKQQAQLYCTITKQGWISQRVKTSLISVRTSYSSCLRTCYTFLISFRTSPNSLWNWSQNVYQTYIQKEIKNKQKLNLWKCSLKQNNNSLSFERNWFSWIRFLISLILKYKQHIICLLKIIAFWMDASHSQDD